MGSEVEGHEDGGLLKTMEIKTTVPSGEAIKTSAQTNLPWSVRLNNYLYPPHIPPSVQLLRRENIVIPACYFLVGALQGLSGALMNVYPVDLGATEAQQTTIVGLRGLPASFKLIYGFISDGNLLFGYRRKSYMFLGWGLASLTMVLLFLNIKANGKPSIDFLSIIYFLFGFGFWYADVMADSVVAEKAKLEPEGSRGSLQSTCYALRFFALMLFAPISTALYPTLGPAAIVFVMGALPICIMPLVYMFREEFHPVVLTTKQQCNEIWNTVCSRAVWQPMGFVYIYNVLQVGNSAWKQYLVSTLGFTSVQLNSLLIASYVLLYLGIMAYKYYFIKWSWRSVYVITTVLNGFLSILQILLIKDITFGLGAFWFSLGDDAFAEFIAGVQFLPTTIMMVHLCPSGSEGASYAMFTTVHNAALNLSSMISTSLLSIWDVSKDALVASSPACEGCTPEDGTCTFEKGGITEDACGAGDLSGMIKLTLLTTALQISGLLFVKLLPGTREELMALNYGHMSKVGGFIFLTITGISLLYSIVAGILNIVDPGWSGES
mmetsp:Transcript_14458/g.29723  ORF Transcript_14458/g.29723 Transcript_14458/m.29723 type:complete len:549 (+) Transcript_14458:1-1647(+)